MSIVSPPEPQSVPATQSPAASRSRIHRLASEGGWIVTGQVAAVAGALALIRTLTEHLTPAEYGRLALGLTLAGFVNQVVTGGLSNGITRYYAIANEQGDLASYLGAARQLLGLAILAVLMVGVLATVALSVVELHDWIGLVIAALALSLSAGTNAFIGGIQNAARHRAVVATHGGLEAWLRVAVALALMRWLGPTGVVAVLSYALTSVLITTSQFFFLRRLVGNGSAVPAACASWRRQMWVFSWPFALWGIFTWTQQAADRWALQTFSSMQDVGMYAVVYQLGFMPIGLLLGMVMNLLAPILFQRASSAQAHTGDSVHSITWRAAQLGLLATLGVLVFTLALHDLIFKLLVAAEYQSISYLLPWMSLAGGLFAAGQMLSLKLLSEMRPATMLAAKILTSILGVVASIAGAYYYGTHGVVFAMVAFSGTFFAWMALLARQPLRTMHPHREGDTRS